MVTIRCMVDYGNEDSKLLLRASNIMLCFIGEATNVLGWYRVCCALASCLDMMYIDRMSPQILPLHKNI